MKYKKSTPRITVKFIDANTEDTLFEIPNRNHMDMGELFSDYYASAVIEKEIKDGKYPKKILILAVAELELI
jgi:uncharacterized FlaG/YvyC family protein